MHQFKLQQKRLTIIINQCQVPRAKKDNMFSSEQDKDRNQICYYQMMNQEQKYEQIEISLDQSRDDSLPQIGTSYINSNLLKGTGVFSTLFFTWISHFLKVGKQSFINDTRQLPRLDHSMNPKFDLDKMIHNLNSVHRSQRPGFTLFKAIIISYKSFLALIGILALVTTIITMSAPLLTHQVISYVKLESVDRKTSDGVWLVSLIILVTLGKAIIQTHLYYQFAVFGFNLSNTISLLLYRKSLKYPSLSSQKYTLSQIINYSQVDGQRMTALGPQLVSVLFIPLQIVLGVWIMYGYMGYSFTVGVITMKGLIMLTISLAKCISKLNQITNKWKDQRMKGTQEILNLIRYIKINALEGLFYRRVKQKRQKQLLSNCKKGVLETIIVFLYAMCCPLIIFLTFWIYVQLGHEIDSTVAFSTLVIFNILQQPMRQFPSAMTYLIQMHSSIIRIEAFLFSEQIDKNKISTGESNDDFAVKIQSGMFGWKSQNSNIVESRNDKKTKTKNKNKEHNQDSQLSSVNIKISERSLKQNQSQQLVNFELQNSSSFVLKNINIQLQKGKFIVVLGDVSSGKSSFLLSLINQMRCSDQSLITVNGSVAYSGQKPSIIQGTVRDNILMFKSFNKRKLKQAIHYSCLTKDMDLLVQGDHTEIGQGGANLSGGQKVRIDLARALYSDKDIVLLDDILSAVDVNVATFLLKQTILKYLKGKTIILATHKTRVAEYADWIIIMKEGKVKAEGRFEDVKGQIGQTISQIANENKSLSQIDEKITKEQITVKNTIQQITGNNRNNKKDINITQKTIQELIIPEDHKKGSISMQVIKGYLILNGGVLFVLGILLSMTGWLILSILANIQLKQWCQDENKTNQYLYIYLLFAIGSSLCAIIRAFISVFGVFKQGHSIHKRIVTSLLCASLNDFYLRVPVGRILNRLSKDLREIDESISSNLSGFLINLFQLGGSLVICIYSSSIYMILPAIAILFVCNKLRKYYMKTQREVIRLEAKTNSVIAGGFVTTIKSLPTIRAYKVEQQYLNKQIQNVTATKGARITREALESWFAFRLSVLGCCISIVSIILAMLSQQTQPAMIGLLLAYAFTLNEDIISVTFSFTSLEGKMVSVQRLLHFTKIQPQRGFQNYGSDWDTNGNNKDLSNIIQHGNIKFSNVSVRYRSDLPDVLNKLNVTIKAGQRVGIVGRTGAGKSTLFNLLLRIIIQNQGDIFIDDKLIQDYELSALRRNITIIDQQAALIQGNLRQNLDICNIYSDSQLTDLLQQFDSKSLLSSYDLYTPISNISFSSGERQIICIYRAILSRSKIVLIDEATAHIDNKSDELIHKIMQEHFKGKTVLTIAHRLSTLKNCNKLMVIQEGCLVEYGTPEQLQMLENGTYAQMIQRYQLM